MEAVGTVTGVVVGHEFFIGGYSRPGFFRRCPWEKQQEGVINTARRHSRAKDWIEAVWFIAKTCRVRGGERKKNEERSGST